MNKQLKQKVISLIEGYLNGEINYEEFHSSWILDDGEIAKDKVAATAIHMVDHYDSDQDIMGKDPEYREYMKNQVMEALKDLKNTLQ